HDDVENQGDLLESVVLVAEKAKRLPAMPGRPRGWADTIGPHEANCQEGHHDPEQASLRAPLPGCLERSHCSSALLGKTSTNYPCRDGVRIEARARKSTTWVKCNG